MIRLEVLVDAALMWSPTCKCKVASLFSSWSLNQLLSKQRIVNQVRYILLIFSVFLFSLTVISCKSSDDDITSSTSSTGLFVTVGDNGIILTSSDGISWTKRTSGTTKNLYGVTYGNSTFVTVGDNGTILTSSDGTTWTSRTSNTSKDLYGVTYGNNTFVTEIGRAHV